MTNTNFVALPNRGLVSVSGENAIDFLQGLVTNDVNEITKRKAIYAALLTPQGKYLHDFFIFPCGDAIFIDCDGRRRDDLVRRLTRYRLRARLEIKDISDEFDTFAVIGEDAAKCVGLTAEEGNLASFTDGIAYVDPRNAALGVRALFPTGCAAKPLFDAGAIAADKSMYDSLRMSLGIAEGAPEIQPEKSFPMDFGLDELHGVSFTKGCYVGQEVTARMKSRDLVRKRLVPVNIEGASPDIGTPVNVGEVAAGELRAFSGTIGLALVRIDLLEQTIAEKSWFNAGTARLYPREAP